MDYPLNTICTFRQTGTTLSGACTIETGGPYPIAGEVKDGAFTFKHRT